jgi:hypothetical protein
MQSARANHIAAEAQSLTRSDAGLCLSDGAMIFFGKSSGCVNLPRQSSFTRLVVRDHHKVLQPRNLSNSALHIGPNRSMSACRRRPDLVLSVSPTISHIASPAGRLLHDGVDHFIAESDRLRKPGREECLNGLEAMAI